MNNTRGLRLLDAYDYVLPDWQIAQQPASPRDAAKLLVYDRQSGEMCVDTFRHLTDYLPKHAVLVFNQSKVIPARVIAKKDTGGKVELLILRWQGRKVTAIADRRLARGQTVSIGPNALVVTGQHEAEFSLQMKFAPTRFMAVLDRYGAAPIPPYIKHTPLSQAKLKKEYQTIFAKQPGSAAAPTASLHFTNRLLRQIHAAGVASAFVTLHVGLGTFAPLKSENLQSGKLHAEQFEISPAAAARLNRYKQQGRPIIAVGTTVARTLESATRLPAGQAGRGRLSQLTGATQLFIRPGYGWKFVDGLITNFHVPRSSLMMLVSAMTGRQELLALYEFAKRKKFRFFSFGDGMLVR